MALSSSFCSLDMALHLARKPAMHFAWKWKPRRRYGRLVCWSYAVHRWHMSSMPHMSSASA
eukprot:3642957-Pyramimonas_sp.AAC.1